MLHLKSSPDCAIVMKCNAVEKVMHVLAEVDFWISVFLVTDAALSLFFLYNIHYSTSWYSPS